MGFKHLSISSHNNIQNLYKKIKTYIQSSMEKQCQQLKTLITEGTEKSQQQEANLNQIFEDLSQLENKLTLYGLGLDREPCQQNLLLKTMKSNQIRIICSFLSHKETLKLRFVCKRLNKYVVEGLLEKIPKFQAEYNKLEEQKKVEGLKLEEMKQDAELIQALPNPKNIINGLAKAHLTECFCLASPPNVVIEIFSLLAKFFTGVKAPNKKEDAWKACQVQFKDRDLLGQNLINVDLENLSLNQVECLAQSMNIDVHLAQQCSYAVSIILRYLQGIHEYITTSYGAQTLKLKQIEKQQQIINEKLKKVQKLQG